jgi:hypothetical protein
MNGSCIENYRRGDHDSLISARQDFFGLSAASRPGGQFKAEQGFIASPNDVDFQCRPRLRGTKRRLGFPGRLL